MKALKYPFSIDLNGRIATVDNYPDVVRGQLIDVLMTNNNERIMRPIYGSNMQAALFDPQDELVQTDAANEIIQRVNLWAPRVVLRTVRFETLGTQPGRIFVTITYSAGAFDEARQLRLPVSAFLSEETPV